MRRTSTVFGNLRSTVATAKLAVADAEARILAAPEHLRQAAKPRHLMRDRRLDCAFYGSWCDIGANMAQAEKLARYSRDPILA